MVVDGAARPDAGGRRLVQGDLGACERFYAGHGIRIERVLTDNGTCFKRRWQVACDERGIGVRKTRPYRPQTNGKVERFIRTPSSSGPTPAATSTSESAPPRSRRRSTRTIATVDTAPSAG